MKIAIIGGGWVGCHLAMKLKNEHNIVLFDKNDRLFCETSYNNQNRLHYGFHYARNNKTRKMCKETFDLFIKEYGFLTEIVKNNLYCVPEKESTLDYETYIEIFRNFKMEKSEISFKNIDGCINTGERYINFRAAKEYFNKELKDVFVQRDITKKKLVELSNEYDLVINSTNNFIKDTSFEDSFYELTISLIYKKINNIPFDALTLVDGNFFSLYPYTSDNYTLTDVEYTPIKRFNSLKNIKKFLNKIDSNFVNERIKIMEKKVKHYFPNFSSFFTYDSYFLSTKSKIISNSDERYPVITKHDNVINCFTGKIQGIYIIENYIKNEITSW